MRVRQRHPGEYAPVSVATRCPRWRAEVAHARRLCDRRLLRAVIGVVEGTERGQDLRMVSARTSRAVYDGALPFAPSRNLTSAAPTARFFIGASVRGWGRSLSESARRYLMSLPPPPPSILTSRAGSPYKVRDRVRLHRQRSIRQLPRTRANALTNSGCFSTGSFVTFDFRASSMMKPSSSSWLAAFCAASSSDSSACVWSPIAR